MFRNYVGRRERLLMRVCNSTTLGTRFAIADIPEVAMRREIWFHRTLWSYIPCHWKGWAVIIAFVLPVGLGSSLGASVLDRFGFPEADWLPFLLLFLPAWLLLLMIAKRHS